MNIHYLTDRTTFFFLQFQMLFQFAILLFNCKNYDENIFSKRFFSTDFAVKNLRDMPHLSNDLLLIDALNTVAFQLFLVIHHWDSTDVFDNVVSKGSSEERYRGRYLNINNYIF